MPKQPKISKFFAKGASKGPYDRPPTPSVDDPLKSDDDSPKSPPAPATRAERIAAWYRSFKKENLKLTLDRLIHGYRDKSGSAYPAAETNSIGCVLAIKTPNRSVSHPHFNVLNKLKLTIPKTGTAYIQIAPVVLPHERTRSRKGQSSTREAFSPPGAHRLVVLLHKT